MNGNVVTRHYASIGLAADRRPDLLLGVKILLAAALGYCLYRLTEEPVAVVAAASLIAVAALAPSYLWAAGQVPGLPIFPLHALALIWTYALPLVAGHPEIAAYEQGEILFSALCVVMYGLIGTAGWYVVGRLRRSKRTGYLVLPDDRGYSLLISALVAGGVLILLVVSHSLSLDAGVFGIVRSSVLAFASVALFVLAVRWGRGELRPMQRAAFAAAAAFYIVMHLSTVFLVGAIVSTAAIFIGYMVGARRIPWAGLLSALLVFAILHGGKSEVRERYWNPSPQAIGLLDLPSFLLRWVAAGLEESVRMDDESDHQPIYERVSLMHLLLLAQRSSPDRVPYLEGATYVVIPRLLIPRIFDPEKPSSHQGTTILNVEFGLQTDEDTYSTTIGWGLLNEAYANFGVFGVGFLALLMGALFGAIGRLTAGVPLMSFETLIGVTFCAIAIQSEFTMGVFATALFQSLAALLLVLPFLVRRHASRN